MTKNSPIVETVPAKHKPLFARKITWMRGVCKRERVKPFCDREWQVKIVDETPAGIPFLKGGDLRRSIANGNVSGWVDGTAAFTRKDQKTMYFLASAIDDQSVEQEFLNAVNFENDLYPKRDAKAWEVDAL